MICHIQSIVILYELSSYLQNICDAPCQNQALLARFSSAQEPKTHGVRLNCRKWVNDVFVFVIDSLMNCTMASKEAYLATELDRVRGCNLEDSNLAAVIEDYFEGRVEPVDVASAGAGEDHIEPAPVGSVPADFPNWGK